MVHRATARPAVRLLVLVLLALNLFAVAYTDGDVREVAVLEASASGTAPHDVPVAADDAHGSETAPLLVRDRHRAAGTRRAAHERPPPARVPVPASGPFGLRRAAHDGDRPPSERSLAELQVFRC